MRRLHRKATTGRKRVRPQNGIVAVAENARDERAEGWYATRSKAPERAARLGRRRGPVHRAERTTRELTFTNDLKERTMPTKKTLTTRETAALLDIVYGTLRKWHGEGKGPRFSRPGGTSRGRAVYAIEDVKAWIAAEKAKAKR